VPSRRDLRTALEAADAADAVTAARFRAADLSVEVKADLSPVSEADKGAERAIREVIAKVCPDDGILGEEYGDDAGSGRRWIIDPIDATVNYVRGVPVWGSLIALEEDGELVVGVVSSPALASRWWAMRGAGAWHNAERIHVSAIDELGGAHMSFNALKACFDAGIGDKVLTLTERCERVRGFGDFWSFMLLAEGSIDVVVEPIAAVWDLAPLQVIVEEAGGTMTDLGGTRTIESGNALATNGRLHQEVFGVLSPES
jgi:histidinol-phosphatase